MAARASSDDFIVRRQYLYRSRPLARARARRRHIHCPMDTPLLHRGSDPGHIRSRIIHVSTDLRPSGDSTIRRQYLCRSLRLAHDRARRRHRSTVPRTHRASFAAPTPVTSSRMFRVSTVHSSNPSAISSYTASTFAARDDWFTLRTSAALSPSTAAWRNRHATLNQPHPSPCHTPTAGRLIFYRTISSATDRRHHASPSSLSPVPSSQSHAGLASPSFHGPALPPAGRPCQHPPPILTNNPRPPLDRYSPAPTPVVRTLPEPPTPDPPTARVSRSAVTTRYSSTTLITLRLQAGA